MQERIVANTCEKFYVNRSCNSIPNSGNYYQPESIPAKQIIPESPVGLEEDAVPLKVVDSKKDDPKVKRANVDEVEGLENVEPRLVMSMECLKEDRDELDKANEEANDKVLKIEQFILKPSALGDLLTEDNQKAFKYLQSVNAEDSSRFMLDNVVFGIFDDGGNIDADINGRHHELMIDLNPDNATQYTFRQTNPNDQITNVSITF
eukprot:Gb_11755 [translate_table: standard]